MAAILMSAGISLAGILGYCKVSWLFITLLSILFLRETVQFMVSPTTYICNFENWVEASIIILCTMLCCPNILPTNLLKCVAAFTIVLSWAELITLALKYPHPWLNDLNLYLTMFYKVTKTFGFLLLGFAMFIVAFSLGFYILLHSDKLERDSERYVFFDSPWLALIKTATMFVGELEFSNIPIDRTSSMYLLSYVFFLIYIFFIVVVLMNLLNGLAIIDIREIQDMAEIVAWKSRLGTILHTEMILTSEEFQVAESYWDPIGNFKRARNLIKSLIQSSTDANAILLFPTFMPTKKLTLRPNVGKDDELSPEVRTK